MVSVLSSNAVYSASGDVHRAVIGKAGGLSTPEMGKASLNTYRNTVADGADK